MAQSLVFSPDTSDPVDTIQLVHAPLPDCGPTQVQVRFLAAPINPLDIAVLQGKYVVKPQNSITLDKGKTLWIPGSDGVARVVTTGSAVSKLQPGDLVILRTHCRGSWRTHAVLNEDDLLVSSSVADPRIVCMLRMGVSPAYFLLRDYHPLEPGDWIIQNAATGTISHFVSQFARHYGIKVVSIIRNREDADELERIKHSLRSSGATLVLTEDELRTTNALDGMRISLAIDSVSNDALSVIMAQKLVAGATFLTAGFLGPSSTPGINFRQCLWQKNITLKAFRLSDSLGKRSLEQQTALLDWFGSLLSQGTILMAPSIEYVPWKREDNRVESTLKAAIRQSFPSSAVGGKKKIIVFEP